ncbi:endonuclease [Alistipes sp. An116]|uniref:endonuclease/exonuclease/phosphatase family protein n=1 Tax=Alistipes sp. An116 TaxID=1965546 RepID=UPI000B37F9D1|nr:endonuclease/exonuclease/phosphatase family protein [Alistipes sp. An116]OUQ52680.1 endonuclease [Alistipes sp. An116]
MKINKILGAMLLLGAMLPLAGAQAQTLQLKCMSWNVKALELKDNTNVSRDITRFVDAIRRENPDIVCFNEFETASGLMSSKEKLTEFARELGMFPFFIWSYDKDNGYYGNGILSKYPIVNSKSVLLGMYTGEDQRSVGWADILVPTDANPDGVKVRVICTHLDAFGGNETCFEQAKEVIADAVVPATQAGIPSVLMGDMNCGPSTEAIKEYQKYGTKLCNNDTTFSGGSKLDYFLSFPAGEWSCTDFKVLNTGDYPALSDHYPIIGTAVLK